MIPPVLTSASAFKPSETRSNSDHCPNAWNYACPFERYERTEMILSIWDPATLAHSSSFYSSATMPMNMHYNCPISHSSMDPGTRSFVCRMPNHGPKATSLPDMQPYTYPPLVLAGHRPTNYSLRSVLFSRTSNANIDTRDINATAPQYPPFSSSSF